MRQSNLVFTVASAAIASLSGLVSVQAYFGGLHFANPLCRSAGRDGKGVLRRLPRRS